MPLRNVRPAAVMEELWVWSALHFYPLRFWFSIRERSRRRRGARRRGQRREWEEFEVLDARMKKFPLKLPADWAAAAAGVVVRGTVPTRHTRNRHALYPSKRGARVK